jgi:hypothetical protein
LANHSWPWSWSTWARLRYAGIAFGLLGALGSIVKPASALISLRKIVKPAPRVGL